MFIQLDSEFNNGQGGVTRLQSFLGGLSRALWGGTRQISGWR